MTGMIQLPTRSSASQAPLPRRSWRLRTFTELDGATAERMGGFIRTFHKSASPDAHRSHTGEYYQWKLNRNPAGDGLVALAFDGERIVGTHTLTRKVLVHEGRPVAVYELGDGFTDPAYQRQGIFSASTKVFLEHAQAHGIQLVYVAPNENSRPILERKFRFRRSPALSMSLCVLPLSLDAVAQVEPHLDRRAARVLSPAYRALLEAGSRMIRCRARPTELAFGEEYDRFDRALGARYPHHLSRTADALSFRFVRNPEHSRYELLEARDAAGTLRGALVSKHTVEKGLPTSYVADLMADSSGTARQLWTALVSGALERRDAFVALWANHAARSVVQLAPLTPLPVQKKHILFHSRDALPARLASRWLFSIGDTDNI